MVALLKEKLAGTEVALESGGKGLLHFVHQAIEFKSDAITREAMLEFQVLVRG